MASTEFVETNSLGLYSLPVPSVRELAKKSLTTIPDRYIRLNEDQTSVEDSTSLTIPVIDLQKLLSIESSDYELSCLHSACKEWGFFQLVNHGISSSLIEKMKSAIYELFELPLEEKKKFSQRQGDLEGFGQAFVVSEDQKLDWADLFYLTTFPAHARKPYIYDILPQTFRESFERYAVELQKVALILLDFMAKALKMDEEELRKLFHDSYQGFRINYYPPCPKPEKAIGLTSHSDSSSLTILLHVNDVQGLEIWKEGKWITVKPLPNAFTINIGDVLEIISNGVYKSVMHRATVNSKQERISLAAFTNPNSITEVGPAYSLINSENPPLFERITVGNYQRKYLSRELKDKTVIESLKIQPSS